MHLPDLTKRAMEIRRAYADLEQAHHGRAWTREEIMLGFVGDVGNLAKLVLVQEGVRDIPSADEKLVHELSNCLWSVLVLAHLYNVELERAFLATMDDLEAHIDSRRSPLGLPG